MQFTVKNAQTESSVFSWNRFSSTLSIITLLVWISKPQITILRQKKRKPQEDSSFRPIYAPFFCSDSLVASQPKILHLQVYKTQKDRMSSHLTSTHICPFYSTRSVHFQSADQKSCHYAFLKKQKTNFCCLRYSMRVKCCLVSVHSPSLWKGAELEPSGSQMHDCFLLSPPWRLESLAWLHSPTS